MLLCRTGNIGANNGWGVPKFDEINYPNPAGFIKELHDLNAHFNISIWANPDKNSDNR